MSARMEFDNELEQLHADLVRMGAMVEQSIEKSISALRTENRELAEMIIHGDHAVDSMEKTIETRCLKLLLRQQPVARDLRSISTALKIVTDMERRSGGRYCGYQYASAQQRRCDDCLPSGGDGKRGY